MFMYSLQVYRIKVSSFYSSSIHVWKCNYYAIQIFYARLKVKILKYIVNLGRQQLIIVQKSAFLSFEYVTRDSTSKQKQEKFFTV